MKVILKDDTAVSIRAEDIDLTQHILVGKIDQHKFFVVGVGYNTRKYRILCSSGYQYGNSYGPGMDGLATYTQEGIINWIKRNAKEAHVFRTEKDAFRYLGDV